MKKRLELNFLQAASRTRGMAGVLLLLAGLGMLVEFAVSYRDLHAMKQGMLNQVEASHILLDMSGKARYEQFSAADHEAAGKVFDRLSAPWEAIFTGLESIKNKNIAIRSIQPDVQTGILQIEGEGKDYASVLTLVAQLRVAKPFLDVFLLRHEVKRDDPQHPVSFLISAKWVTPK